MVHRSNNPLYNKNELPLYVPVKRLREGLLKPLVKWLAERRVSPDALSYLGLFMVVPFIYFFGFHPWIAFIFLLLNILFDALDGQVARERKIESERGALLDMACDYTSFFVHVLTFLFFGLIDAFWTSVFLVAYMALEGLASLAHFKKVKIFPVLRPKYFLYFFFLVWLLTGVNYFDPLLVFLAVYLVITNVFIFSKIRWSV